MSIITENMPSKCKVSWFLHFSYNLVQLVVFSSLITLKGHFSDTLSS